MVRATIAFIFILSGAVQAQDAAYIESMMVSLQHMIGNGESDLERDRASESFREKLLMILHSPEGFEYPFSNLAKLGKTDSPDKAFRIISWNQPRMNGTYKYHAYIVLPGGKLIELNDQADLSHADEAKVYTADNWYGALYYQIHPVKTRNEAYYVLLGWDGNNKSSNKKVMDALYFGKKGEVFFGKPVFATESGIRHRRVFEYAKEVQMTLTYLPEKDAIVFDHLEPRLGYAVGNFSYYGPSNQHDAYRLVKNTWELELNTEMIRPRSQESRSQFNFPQRPDLNRKRESPAPPK